METEAVDTAQHNETAKSGNSTEVRTRRRTFSAEYKARILAEANACKHGELGLLLRREGLYSSTLESWRKQQRSGSQAALAPKKRGRKATSPKAETVRLMRENARLLEKLRQAELIIDVQKKLCTMLGLTPAVTDL